MHEDRPAHVVLVAFTVHADGMEQAQKQLMSQLPSCKDNPGVAGIDSWYIAMDERHDGTTPADGWSAAFQPPGYSSDAYRRFGEEAHLRSQVTHLEEQLLMARIEAKDVTEFREREQHEYKHVLIGFRLAIQSLASGLKGGDK